jgi:hypothetical protein
MGQYHQGLDLCWAAPFAQRPVDQAHQPLAGVWHLQHLQRNPGFFEIAILDIDNRNLDGIFFFGLGRRLAPLTEQQS